MGFNVETELEADVDEEVLDALGTEIEERCPVGDNIGNPTPTTVNIESLE